METKLEEWLCLFIGEERLIKMVRRKNEKINKVVKVLDIMSMSEQERADYNARLMWKLDYNSALKLKEQEKERLKERAKKQGKIELVKNLIKLGMPIEQICEASSFSKEEVAKLMTQKAV